MSPLLSRTQLISLLGVTAIVGLAWGYLFILSQSMSGKDVMPDMAMLPSATPFTPTAIMWSVMMVGMMLPSATPMILLFTAEHQRQRDPNPLLATGAFALGYLIVWFMFAVAAAALQVGLIDFGLMSPSLVLDKSQLVAVILMAASAYEFSPVKRHFLKLCSVQPLHFIHDHWRHGIGGAIQEGALHGWFCFVCCFALMMLLFVFGVMNLFWIAILGVMVLLQKLLPYGFITTTVSGFIVGSIAVVVLVVPAWLPSIRTPSLPLLPFAEGFAGVLFIAVLAAIEAWGQDVAEVAARQRVLFRELQHRVANTLHLALGTLEMAEQRIDTNPAEAKRIIREQMARISSSAQVHRSLNDPALFDKGLPQILSGALAGIIDSRSVHLKVDIDQLRLTYDQMSAITMIVIEVANNAQKHVYNRQLGTELFVAVHALPPHRAVLSVIDDGPGWLPTYSGQTDRTLGLGILQDLAAQLRGKLTMSTENGTQVTVVFPTGR